MNAAEENAIRRMVATLGALRWKPYKFYDGDEYQRGEDVHNMTADEVVEAVASVDDGLLYFRTWDSKAGKWRKGTVRTIPDHCRDGIEVINDHSVAHGFGDAMERVYEAWEADHA